MPAGYAITSTSAYPSVDAFFLNPDQAVSGPYTVGSQLVVTTDWGVGGPDLLTYALADQSRVPMAGSLSVSVCIDSEKSGPPSK